MAEATSNPIVINSITHQHEWPAEAQAAMQSGREIIFVSLGLGNDRTSQLVRLCTENGYQPPAPLPPERVKEYQAKLKLTDFGAKEQGLLNTQIYVLRPS
jgi:hypothetical protein